ncbi:MAG: hypothetical protein KDK99_00420 [Verrucomicrobiales bacterium]|nr:hypothetical protein [Verrucomicrobiales bacterium]
MAATALAALMATSSAQAAPRCDELAADVQAAIAKDKSKTLMIVEDALVVNESCACDIVRAAIQAADADETLVQQIVQTAIAVAPKMAPVITECAGMDQNGIPKAVVASGKSGKDGKSVVPMKAPAEVLPPQKKSDTSSEYAIPSNIRGVYLMAPGGVGYITQQVPTEEKEDKPEHKRRKRHPVSPSYAAH